MIHEGAKCARHAQAFVDDKADHPWIEELVRYTHLGWPGGVNSADRVDWSPIKKLERDRRVVLVCDNDVSGQNITSGISRHLQRSLMAIMFDDRFHESFDLADEWPSHPAWWRPDGRYCGPAMDDFLTSATWATAIVPTKKGKPAHKIVDMFAKEHLWASRQDLFVNRRRPNHMRGRVEFNSRVRPFSDVDDTARLLVKLASVQCDGVTYLPGEPAGVISTSNGRLINTYVPGEVKPKRGDPKPFLDFVEHLIPLEDERREVLRWCATLVARPDVRMRYGLLLISETQGVGKTTLGQDVLAQLVGMHNTSFPSEGAIVNSDFTSWIAHKRLAVVHEIYAGHNRKAYDRLKDKNTDNHIDVNEKYIRPYTIENWIHIFACSNSIHALRLDSYDRRWFVPRATEQQKPKEYWEGFHKWLREDGLAIVAWHFSELVKQPGFAVGTGEHAPDSSCKREMVAEGRSEGEQIAFDLGEFVAKMKENVVVSVAAVRELIANRRRIPVTDRDLESGLRIGRAMRQAGLMGPERNERGERKRYKVSEVMTEVVANFRIEAGTPWGDLKDHYVSGTKLWDLWNKEM
jgi:Family of unknown function (DUF5906)